MTVRLIAGRAGSGKTHECLMQIAEELHPAPAEGPRLILLVPDQAALQMERALLTTGGLPALGRCEVLSFRRLARRILQETGAPGLTTLSPLGRQMALRLLIARNARTLREFKSVAERPGFIAELAATLSELLQESVSIDELNAAAAAAADTNDPTAPRLHDLALLYRAYLEYLGDTRVDPESVLDLARARIKTLDWITGCRVWIDGFAGLTRQQSRMIVALARHATTVNIALLLDPRDRRAIGAEQPPDDWALFARTDRTWFGLSRQLIEAGVALDPPLLLDKTPPPRFAAASLALLEQRLFIHDRAVDDSSAGASTSAGARILSRTHAPARIPSRTSADAPPFSENLFTQSTAPPASPIRLIRAADRRVEVNAAINALVDLIHDDRRPLRLRDVAIIVRDLEPYHDLISAALTERGIPFFIDHRRETRHHPLVEIVRAALAMYADPRGFGDAAILLLKTGLTGIDTPMCDAVENYILAHGLHDVRLWKDPWTHPVDPDSDPNRKPSQAAADALAAIKAAQSRLLSMICPWRDVAQPPPAALPARDWIARLYQLLEAMNARARLSDICRAADARGDLDAIEEHEQVWRDLMALFDDVVTSLGDEALPPIRLREVLESALGEFTSGLVPATLDQLLVGSIERSRHPFIRAAFVLGFGDKQFPSSASESPVLGDDERALLAKTGVELTQSRMRRLLDERMLAYIALTRASERLWISHPAADEQGRALGASPYWDAIRAIIPDVEVEHLGPGGLESIGSIAQLAGRAASTLRALAEQRITPAEAATISAAYEWARTQPRIATTVKSALRALAPPALAKLDEKAVATLWQPPHDTSVTRLEEFAQCPFKHHVTQGLRLRPRPEADLSPMRLGSLYHAVLEQFVNELADRQEGLRDLEVTDIAERLTRLTADGITLFQKQVRIDAADVRTLERRGHFELLAAIRGERAHLDKTQLSPTVTEQVFGMGDEADLPALELKLSKGCIVTVRGKIDRVDLLPAGNHTLAVVFDYKRRTQQRLRLDEVYHGLTLQLLTYLLVIRDNAIGKAGVRVVPGGAFYLPLLGSYTPVDHPSEADVADFRPFSAYKPRGVLDFDWIDDLDPESAKKPGWSDVFQLYRKKREADDPPGTDLGHIDKSDAVPKGVLAALLKHTHGSLTDLAERWLSGDIRVLPARHGHDIACSRCDYQGICRIETATRQTRPLDPLSNQQVIERLMGPKPAAAPPPAKSPKSPPKKKKGGHP